MYYNKNNIYINESNNILFDLNNFDLYVLDLNTFTKFTNLYECDDIDEYLKQDNSEESNEIYNTFFKYKNPHNNFRKDVTQVRIHTSNTCNLNCKYCYACGGNYNQEDEIMPPDRAKEIAKLVKQSFPHVSVITFFGGEPLLGIDAIEKICEIFGADMRYTMVSNMTVLNDKTIDVINKYNISIIISIDGNKEINDFCRVQKNGEGTFDIIASNIKRLQECTNVTLSIESTYTNYSRKHYTRDEISQYLYKTFNIKQIAVQDVFSEDVELKLPDEEEVSDEFLKKEISDLFKSIMDDTFYQIVDPRIYPLFGFLTKLYRTHFCFAGTNNITIDTHANIYPCQLFLNNKEYFMGNLLR